MNKMDIRKMIAGAMLAVATVGAPMSASAQSLSDILGGLGSAASGVIEGLITKTDLTVEDIAGEWKGNGPAVCFKDENFLKKAGGAAMAGVVEDKLAPYYKQFGLNNISITIDNAGNFHMKMKMITLSGTLAPNGKGTFNFKFTALGSMALGNMTAYVQKSGNNLDIMFDATKMMKLLSTVAKLTNSKLATTASSILSSYDGLCVGFKLTRTGAASGSSKSKVDSTSGGSLGNIVESILGGDSGSKSSGKTTKAGTSPLDKLKNKIESQKK